MDKLIQLCTFFLFGVSSITSQIKSTKYLKIDMGEVNLVTIDTIPSNDSAIACGGRCGLQSGCRAFQQLKAPDWQCIMYRDVTHSDSNSLTGQVSIALLLYV